jgi:hypothetical protein
MLVITPTLKVALFFVFLLHLCVCTSVGIVLLMIFPDLGPVSCEHLIISYLSVVIAVNVLTLQVLDIGYVEVYIIFVFAVV